MASQPLTETRGHRLLRRWMSKDPRRTQTAVADACDCTHVAVGKWLAKNMRPRAGIRTVLASLAAIPEEAWLRPEERQTIRAARRNEATRATRAA